MANKFLDLDGLKHYHTKALNEIDTKITGIKDEDIKALFTSAATYTITFILDESDPAYDTSAGPLDYVKWYASDDNRNWTDITDDMPAQEYDDNTTEWQQFTVHFQHRYLQIDGENGAGLYINGKEYGWDYAVILDLKEFVDTGVIPISIHR